MNLTHIGNNYLCTCPSGYIELGASAFGPTSCLPSFTATPFQSLESQYQKQSFYDSGLDKTVDLNSLAFKHYFASSATSCTYYGSESNAKACQTLANLCALTKFDFSPNTICSVFSAIMTKRDANPTSDVQSVSGWQASLPWLIYGEDSAKDVCKDKSLKLKVSFFKF